MAGHDPRFGHKNQGTPELLAAKCAELGLGCDIIPKVEIGGVTVSSTYIRRLVELGQVERANRFLGHPHTLTGTVRHGRGLGSSRLFPTATSTDYLLGLTDIRKPQNKKPGWVPRPGFSRVNVELSCRSVSGNSLY